MELLVWIVVPTCVCMACVYKRVFTHTRAHAHSSIQLLLTPLNGNEDGGVQIFSFLLENHIYFLCRETHLN